MGTTGKSGKFLYYSCNNRLTKGREACNAPSINARKLEEFVVDRVKENILTKDNLRQLAQLINEELSLRRRQYKKQLQRLTRDIKSVEQKLSRLYTALESGKVDIDDLAPRLKDLRAEHRKLNEKRDEALDDMNQTAHRGFDAIEVEEYIADLRRLLHTGSFLECKALFGSFVRRVDFAKRRVGIEYTMPSLPDYELTGGAEVPNTRADGSPGRIRTYDLAVNSRPLYR